MSNTQRQLARKSLDRSLERFRDDPVIRPARGWTRAIRDALGMTTRQLAQRLGVVPSRITAIEKAEVSDAVTLKTLRETAAAMNCELVYAFVPMKPLNEIVREQAEAKAHAELMRINHTMRLENQSVADYELAERQRDFVSDYLGQYSRKLWDTD